jgi:hypothetical protein
VPRDCHAAGAKAVQDVPEAADVRDDSHLLVRV